MRIFGVNVFQAIKQHLDNSKMMKYYVVLVSTAWKNVGIKTKQR